MVIRKWLYSEELKIIENYSTMTIKELLKILPDRNVKAINSKINRLKSQGRITTKRDKERIRFHLNRWQKRDKEKRFGFILNGLS